MEPGANLLRTLHNDLGHAILMLDKDLNPVLVTEPLKELFHIDDRGTSILSAITAATKDPKEVDQKLARILNAKQNASDLLELSDGRWFEQTYRALFSGQELQAHVFEYEDVTRRRKTESMLMTMSNIQHTLLNGVNYSIVQTDISGTIISFNRGAEQMLGYKASDLIGKRTPLIFHSKEEIEQRAAELTAELKRPITPDFEVFTSLVRHGIVETREWKYILASGAIIDVSLSVSSIRNAAGEIIGYLGISRDITEQKNAEKALKVTERRYQTILENSTDIIFKTNRHGRFTFVNPVSQRITGFSAEELLTMRYLDLVRPDKKKEVQDFYQQQIEQKKASTYYEFPILTKTGSEVWIGQSVQVSINENNAIELISLAIDITRQKNAEKVLKAQEEKYRNIIENMKLGLLEVDLNENIQYFNEGFAAMSGFNEGELLGKNAAELFAKDEAKSVVAEKNELRAKGESDSYEVRVKNNQGEEKWWMISGAPNFNDKGEMIGSIGIHLDITEQKKLTGQLEAARQRAEEASQAREAFLANMSHEIRTPLNGIIGMIRELSYEDLTHKQKKYVSNASMASQHLLAVLNNILDISKIRAGELVLERYPFRLVDTLREVKQIMNTSAREKGLILSFSTHEVRDLVYMGDAFRIRQILLNLVGNSIKFTNTGGVYVECTVEEFSPSAHKIKITVEDTGIGIEEEYMNRIFKKFTQEDSSTSRKFGGSGLGMAITYELTQLMKGGIEVKSKKHEGTTVEISFELETGSMTPAEGGKPRIAPAMLSGRRILLVEDNDFNRAVARKTLERYECKIEEAENGKVAIEFLQNDSAFDVILMDLQMPEMDGIEATRHLKEKMKITIPIIALTANAFKSEIELCRQVGFVDYITKPFEEHVMLNIISQYLEVTGLQPMEETEKPKLYDLKNLRTISGGEDKFVSDMIKLFIEQTKSTTVLMDQALTEKNYSLFSKLAHKIKPSIDNMGIVSLKEKIRQLETQAKTEQNVDELPSLFVVVNGVLTETLVQLKEEIGE